MPRSRRSYSLIVPQVATPPPTIETERNEIEEGLSDENSSSKFTWRDHWYSVSLVEDLNPRYPFFGFNVISNLVPFQNLRSLTVAAIKCPVGTTTICAKIVVNDNGSLQYQKNWFMNERSMHASVPRIHVWNVKIGREGLSVTRTVNKTCLIGESSPSLAGKFFDEKGNGDPKERDGVQRILIHTV